MGYIALLVVLLVFMLCIGDRLIRSRKNPPYISGDDYDRDEITVYAYSRILRSLPWDYRGYDFVKRKNGKYRMKLKAYDVFSIVVPLFLSLIGIFIVFVCFGIRRLVSKPDDIASILAFLVFLLLINALPNYSQIEARLFFRKTMKKYQDNYHSSSFHS